MGPIMSHFWYSAGWRAPEGETISRAAALSYGCGVFALQWLNDAAEAGRRTEAGDGLAR